MPGLRPHEYIFDVKLAATIRVVANSEHTALATIEKLLDGADLTPLLGQSGTRSNVKEASLYIDDAAGPLLLTLDGAEPF